MTDKELDDFVKQTDKQVSLLIFKVACMFGVIGFWFGKIIYD